MKLKPEEIEARLCDFPEWSQQNGKMTRIFRFDTYLDGVRFVQRTADIAEELNHHPDMLLSYGQVEVSVTTHDAGGITEKDFELAHRIEEAG
ncbi:4a-hydroxytetrahydrobiopterin dehydratase [Paludifilum halophilum]|uniref:Putative pterin-4-alpha-carbinolamine dehydratase n=1 Tax=Paludifilum halophilum TaxID=1642702 RepID=A0A235B659_9BACL|nr:4a-hydroxytetrahydrobiopterin dehydratase [Paludifilum halophilum]OYD07732.1 4a-hydroxytetrahydrobiopterin dehydratase [Paludifilum halophilum]